MNIAKIDLNLLIYLDVLLREKNVTRSASQLNITQPAMSNGLKRLRNLFNDPILVRTSDGMVPTERSRALAPVIRKILLELEEALQGEEEFNEKHSQRVFRIMASDYAASTLLPRLLRKINEIAPNVTIDIMTPSDVTFHDVEAGKIDMAINRFDELPQSFHQKTIWRDSFSCLLSAESPYVAEFNLDTYLSSKHVWVSKTGFGVGVGMDPKDVQKLGWVDEALARLGKHRDIKVFTRNYHVAMQLAYEDGLIATLPTKAAMLHKDDHKYTIVPPPFDIPDIELKMIWSPLLHHDASHIWFRQLVIEAAEQG
ncbi:MULTISPECIES: LysR family transcriptional regulator [unclassified Colwellia]|uniref:LysR family transcriptional regulator n=1 Tax=unclassified Colwellia TaxID=196834 RepID=UPI0015F3ECF0|nr:MULTISPECIES: LysR family transcriptional regulator [unclassified Colwellia]MBA6230642.1 LysR family transcriptional regulator [Colwellia sp. MB02u-7]MBA6234573.1 LysR family transcriptional regulator [Colwellia sp. MB02u-11]MBA6255437.1 LysR family transcriptional regulator [Colwellia sp. MB3u-28]MBA6261577.1 LysR family transcriptional regulator [Colwellia sp. MB3u-41]MBA6301127.1 LysR family transcriptional regulator [Colwellia sp. MB3u-22]